MSSSESPRRHLAARVPSLQQDPAHLILQSKPLLRYILIISFCAFPLGWDLGTTGNLMDLPSFRARLNVSAQVTGVLISVFNVGCICACTLLFVTKSTLRLGHLMSFRICHVVFLFGSAISLCSLTGGPSSLYLYSIGRMFQGASAGALCVIGPIYISHISTFSSMNVAFLALFQVIVALFVFLGNCLFIYTGVYSELIFCVLTVLVPIFALICLTCLPESPREILILGDPRRFRQTLDKLLVDMDKDETWICALHVLKTSLFGENARAEKNTLDKRRLAVCCILSFLQQMSGATFFFYFGKTMFDLLVVVSSPVKFSGLLLSVCNLAGTTISGFLVRLRGARMPLFSGLILLSALILAFATMGIVVKIDGTTLLGIPMLVTSCFYLFVFATTWGPCTAVLSMEISQADERIMSCLVICGWATNVLVVSLFPLLVDRCGLGAMYVFLFFTFILIWVTRKDFFAPLMPLN
ncbi:Sugar transporter [Metschnikowia aff. pulcherrima]|uniref:Sugar transporter n=1 Tax=Metschnikowia aff. pulcherrima TaxID=2163413 RepID=A0A4P6XXZ7_9ASCO|nr:Sugar transporter [Metschnikowia aff. pulcherrima]